MSRRPFVQVPTDLLMTEDLSAIELRVLCVIASHVRRKSYALRQDTIAREARTARSTVQLAVTRLEELDLLVVSGQVDQHGRAASVYRMGPRWTAEVLPTVGHTEEGGLTDDRSAVLPTVGQPLEVEEVEVEEVEVEEAASPPEEEAPPSSSASSTGWHDDGKHFLKESREAEGGSGHGGDPDLTSITATAEQSASATHRVRAREDQDSVICPTCRWFREECDCTGEQAAVAQPASIDPPWPESGMASQREAAMAEWYVELSRMARPAAAGEF